MLSCAFEGSLTEGSLTMARRYSDQTRMLRSADVARVLGFGLLGLLLLLGGCDEPKKPPLPEAPEVIEGLAIADKAAPTKHHLAIGTEGESAWRITVATQEVTCEQLRSAYPGRPEGLKGTRVDFWVNQPMEPDGTRGPWTFRSAYVCDGDGERGLTARGAQLDGLTATDAKVSLKGLELACQDRRDMIMWNGPLTAENCGRVARKEEARLQKELTVTIAGQTIPMFGATVRPQGKNFHLRLTRAPHECSSVFTEGYDFYLDVVFSGGDDEQTPIELQFVSLLGDVFPGDPAGSKGKESFVLKAEEPVVGTGEVEMTIEGKIDAGGYPVSFEGKVKPLRCTPM